MSKPKFDPTKPFHAVDSGVKPPFDPNQPYADASLGVGGGGEPVPAAPIVNEQKRNPLFSIKDSVINTPETIRNMGDWLREKVGFLKKPAEAARDVISNIRQDGLSQPQKETISKFARPVLSGGGALVGDVVGGGLTPTGFAGGTLGYAMGAGAADRLDEWMGLKTPPATFQEGLSESERNLRWGALQKLGGDLLAKGLSSAVIEKTLVPFFGALGRVQSGVRQEAGRRLFKDPAALFSKSREAAGEALGAVRKSLGFSKSQSMSDKLSDVAGEKGLEFARGIVSKIENKLPVDANEILTALQGLGKRLEKVPYNERVTRKELSEVYQWLSDRIGSLPGGALERKAAAEFARSATASEFRKLFPVTKSGDISVGRTAFLPAMLGGHGLTASIPIAALQSPSIAGAAIAGAGAATKMAQKAVGSNALRNAAAGGFSSIIQKYRNRKNRK